MSPRIDVQELEEVPADSTVCHYDELPGSAKEHFPRLANADCHIDVDNGIATGFSDCEVIKYTNYFEVTIA